MHALGEMGQTGMHCHPGAVGRRPVSLLTAAADLARSILSQGAGGRWNANGMVPLGPTAIRAIQAQAVRFRLTLPVPVFDRVRWNFVELHTSRGLQSPGTVKHLLIKHEDTKGTKGPSLWTIPINRERP